MKHSSEQEFGSGERDGLALAFSRAASAAGATIMEIYGRAYSVMAKSDASPLTEADEAAESILIAAVERLLPGVPIVAEESVAQNGLPDVWGHEFVLIDPLDGTKEFISRNGEFTVNIALVCDSRPVAGCVYAPAINKLFLGGQHAGVTSLRPGDSFTTSDIMPISTRPYPAEGLTAVMSRSHADTDTLAFIDRVSPTRLRNAGSSIKFCLIAEGEADVYPRFGPTMEWDTAAGHAVLAAAGGAVFTPEGMPLTYGKTERGFKNDAFIAWGGERPL